MSLSNRISDQSIEHYLWWVRWLLLTGLTMPVVMAALQGDRFLAEPWLFLWLATLAVQLFAVMARPQARELRLFLYLLLDILLWNGVVMLTGGASNPFSALLLIPLVLAFLLLPLGYAVAVLIVAVACQLAQLQFVPPMPAGHAGMHGHFFAMVVGFIIAAALLALTLVYLRRQIHSRDRDLQKLREAQLRDEQLLAIGTAAAQLTHEMATPVQSVRLLLEELELVSADQRKDEAASEEPLSDIRQQLNHMEQLLADWRVIAEDVRERRYHPVAVRGLVQSVRQLLVITRPGDQVQWRGVQALTDAQVVADRTLIPAVLSLLHNALDAAAGEAVVTRSELRENCWRLTIFNGGQALSQEVRERLGTTSVASDNGFGVGALVSYATLERFGGRVYWRTGAEGTRTCLELPLHQ